MLSEGKNGEITHSKNIKAEKSYRTGSDFIESAVKSDTNDFTATV